MNKKYWLKGGIILAVIHVAVVLVTSLMVSGDAPNYLLSFVDLPVALFFDSALSAPFQTDIYTLNNSLIYILGTIQWFAIGSFLGWIYAKIRGRNQVGIDKN